MNATTKLRLATYLRRLADRLAPAPAGGCGSGTNWVTYSNPGITFTDGAGYSLTQPCVVADPRFESGGIEWHTT